MLAGSNLRAIVRRKEDFDSGAKPNHTQSLSALQLISGFLPELNSPRQHTGDLPEDDPGPLPRQGDLILFVLPTGFVMRSN
jgi:hypothetical protein